MRLDPTATGSAVASGDSPETVEALSDSTQIEQLAVELAATLSDSDVKSLVSYWETQRGLPPEFDGKLLARSGALIGRPLHPDEKRLVRTQFMYAVKSRATGRI